MKRTKVAIILTVFVNFLYSQDVKDEIISINKAFYKNSTFGMKVVNRAFMDNGDKPVSESRLEVYKMPGKFLYKSQASESMSNGDYKINLDNNKKVIIVNKIDRTLDKKNKVKKLDDVNYQLVLDTVMNYYKEIKTRDVDGKQKEIEFVFKSGLYEFIKVSYDKKTYLVNDYTIRTNVKDGDKRHSYTYLINNTYYDNSVLRKQLFNENNYVVLKNGEYVPVQKYIGYKIVDNVNKKTKNL